MHIKIIQLSSVFIAVIFLCFPFYYPHVEFNIEATGNNFNEHQNPEFGHYYPMNSRSLPSVIDLNTTSGNGFELMTIYGEEQDDNMGNDITSGDINGDGINDLIIGARMASGPSNMRPGCGEVYIIFGNISFPQIKNLSEDADSFIYGRDTGDYIGSTLASGDVNGDNIDDILIGGPYADGPADGRTDAGEVYVIFGNKSFPESIDLNSHSDLIIYGIDSNDHCGSTLNSNDVNGDKIDDIIIGTPHGRGLGNSKIACGEVYIIYGNSSLPSEIDLQTYSNYIYYYGADISDNVGWKLTSGDINGDGIYDIIITAYVADGPGNIRMDCGDIYIIYGNQSLISNVDLSIAANVTIYGKGDWVYAGSDLACGDIHNDGKDDIIIGCNMDPTTYIVFGNSNLKSTIDLGIEANITIDPIDTGDYVGWGMAINYVNNDNKGDIILGASYGDGPGNTRDQCGEVYVVYGKETFPKNLDLATQTDVIIYGVDLVDRTGGILHSDDITGDTISDIFISAGNGDGFNNSKDKSGEIYVIYEETVLKDEFKLIDGSGFKNKTCYAKYKPYTFQVKVTDFKGLDDIKNVTLILDQLGSNYQYTWNRFSNSFTKKTDLNNHTILSIESTASNDGDKNWTIDFKIIFNWTYLDEELSDCWVWFESSYFKKILEKRYYNIYQVENDLNFTGTLSAIGKYQGRVAEGNWVRGGEDITWDGLKVVYENTMEVYPPNDAFSVTVWDNDADFWINTTSSGKNISINSKADTETDLNEIYTINITDVPAYCDFSNITFPIKIDADNVTFTEPKPSSEIWFNKKMVSCGITINDIDGSTVNASSIEYSVSTNNGSDWSNWNNAEQIENAESVVCSVKLIFNNGADNLIRWRAKDVVGNLDLSNNYRIKIDTLNITFSNATPTANEWQKNTAVMYNITIEDLHSGVNASSIEFRISADGIYNYGIWQSARKQTDNNIINCSVTPTFKEGEDNYIQWRAKDVAGNQFESEDYQIKINLSVNHPPTTTLISPSDSNIIKTLTPELSWKGSDPDGNNPLFFNIYLSIDETQIINLDSSALQLSNHVEMKYRIESPLEDSQTYYWTVIPNDGIIDGICNSGIWSFKIDTTVEIPVVMLISPINNSKVTSQNPTFSWHLNYTNKDIVTYNVYIDTLIEPKNFTKDYKITSFVPSTLLTLGETYYWTVIPIANTAEGKIQGECESGIWRFIVDVGFVHDYGVTIELETSKLTVKQGEYITTNVTITNTGNAVDIFDLNKEEGILNAKVILEHEKTPLSLNRSESIKLKLEILVSETAIPQLYNISITAVSNGALSENKDISVIKILQVEVLEKEIISEENGKTDKDVNWALWGAILVIIIILILIISLFIYKRTQAAKIPTVKAELLHAPPELTALPGVTTPAAGLVAPPELPTPAVQVQPQVAGGKGPVPSLAPTPVKPQYQLPQATLSKAQKLGLLKERLLRGDITEETYKELKTEIESSTGGEIPEGEVEDISTIDEQQPPEPIAAPPAVPSQPTVTPTVEAPTPSAPSESPPVEAAPAVTPAVPPPPQPTVTPIEPTTAIPKVAPAVVAQPPPEPKPPEQPKQQSTEDEEELEEE